MKPLRMAAYCRVSTQKEAQLDSLAHQEVFSHRTHTENSWF